MLKKHINIITYDYYNIYNFISFTNDKLYFTNYPATTQRQIGIEQFGKINIERVIFGVNILKHKFGFLLN